MRLVLERLPEATVDQRRPSPGARGVPHRKLVLEYHPEGARLVRDVSLQGPLRRSARFLSRLFTREKAVAPARP